MEFKNNYLTYGEYVTYEGDIPEMSFKRLEYKAEKEIDKKTFGRFKKINQYPTELKMCILDMIDIYDKQNKSGNIKSESDGDYSVTYETANSNESNKNIDELIKTWLSEVKVNGIPVLYCGADENEN
jgi:major membrane immunogen (membrane-anchored lipoprotein)